jgi:hypothetical protein
MDQVSKVPSIADQIWIKSDNFSLLSPEAFWDGSSESINEAVLKSLCRGWTPSRHEEVS